MTPRRPVLWAAALAVSAWSAWIIVHPPAGDQDQVVAAVQRRPGPAGAAAVASPAAAPSRRAAAPAASVPPGTRALLDEQPGSDPFHAPAARVPAPPAAAKAVVAAAPPPPPPPPPAATLPYRFLGLLAERDGSDPRVFLMYGDRLLVARPGDTLDGGWQLERIQPRELQFVRPADRLQLRLAIDEGNPS